MTETPYSPDGFPADLGWFDVTMYDTTGEMTADEWRQQIGKRAFIRDLLTGGRLEQLKNSEMGQLLSYPLLASPVAERRGADSTVFELTPAYARALADGYDESHPEGNGVDTSLGAAALCEDLEGLGHRTYLVVDLGATNDVIKRDFANWLKNFNKSKDLTHIREVSDQTLSNWHGRHKILPYFDLWAWGEWSGNELPSDQRLLELLFKDDLEATVDGQLRTTKLKAMQFITWRMHSALTGQIQRTQSR